MLHILYLSSKQKRIVRKSKVQNRSNPSAAGMRSNTGDSLLWTLVAGQWTNSCGQVKWKLVSAPRLACFATWILYLSNQVLQEPTLTYKNSCSPPWLANKSLNCEGFYLLHFSINSGSPSSLLSVHQRYMCGHSCLHSTYKHLSTSVSVVASAVCWNSLCLCPLPVVSAAVLPQDQ